MGRVRAVRVNSTRGVRRRGGVRAISAIIVVVDGVGRCGAVVAAGVDGASLTGVNDAAILESTGPRRGRNIGASIVDLGELGAVLTGSLLVLNLGAGHLDVLFASSLTITRRFLGADTAIATVITDARVVYVIVGDAGVVGIVNDGHVDVIDGAVVSETIAIPAPAIVAFADVAVAVVNAAVESDVGPPIAGIPVIAATAPTPIARGPKDTYPRRSDPGARHPIVVVIVVCPIARRPDVAFAGA